MNSKTAVVYPIISALIAVAKELGEGVKWRPASHEQMSFMSSTFVEGEEDVSRIPEIINKVSKDAKVLNQFLAENGFSIKLDPFGDDPRKFGVVSILKLALEWLKEGGVCKVLGKYPAVKLFKGVEFFSTAEHKHPVVVITTKSGDEICLSVADDSYTGDRLKGNIERIFEDEMRPLDIYEGVIFPMVDINQEIDISWLKNMPAFWGEELAGIITQALQQTKFAMDEKGVKVESAVAIGAIRLSAFETCRPPLTIDKPFFVVVRRKGLSLPIFSGYIAEDSWKKPTR